MALPHEGWHSRSSSYRGTFDPSLAALELAMSFSAPADPSGFTVALFAPNIVVDARGSVLVAAAEDWDRITALAARAAALPLPDGFNHCWRIQHRRTSQPIDNLLLPLRTSDGSVEWRDPGVYGYDKNTTTLQDPVGEYVHLPIELCDLVGLLREGREGFERGKEDRAMVARVKQVIDEAM